MKAYVHYSLSNAGKKALILSGVEARTHQVIETEATPELLEMPGLTFSSRGMPHIAFGCRLEPRKPGELFEDNSGALPGYDLKLDFINHFFDEPMSVDNLVAWQREVDEKKAKEEREREDAEAAERAAKIAVVLAVPTESLIFDSYNRGGHKYFQINSHAAGPPYCNIPWDAPELAQKKAEVEVLVAAMQKESDEREEAAKKAKVESECLERELEAVEEEAYRQERLQWIEEHGSDRLKLAAKLDMDYACDKVYHEERLALERPGWSYEPNDAEVKDVLNPTLEQLTMLDNARTLYPDDDVTLDYLVISEEMDGRALRAAYEFGTVYQMV